MFKINKRKFANPKANLALILIPSFNYLLLKLSNVEMHREYLWFILIPFMFIIWFFLNFKISKKLNV
jgi:hypothetical protein